MVVGKMEAGSGHSEPSAGAGSAQRLLHVLGRGHTPKVGLHWEVEPVLPGFSAAEPGQSQELVKLV